VRRAGASNGDVHALTVEVQDDPAPPHGHDAAAEDGVADRHHTCSTAGAQYRRRAFGGAGDDHANGRQVRRP
jgi:hypothetical protein